MEKLIYGISLQSVTLIKLKLEGGRMSLIWIYKKGLFEENMLNVNDLKTEYLKNPIGIDAVSPRFSWKIMTDQKNVIQKSYRLVVSSEGECVYDSGVVNSSMSQRVRYKGTHVLKSRKNYDWKIYLTIECNGEIQNVESTEMATFEMGILNSEEWKAKWIEPEEDFEDVDSYKPSPYIRKTFTIEKPIKMARIYQSAHGLYEFWINGENRTNEVFKPGFTSYYKRVQYQTYDITSLLNRGENVWSIQLGDGWWRGISGGLFRNNFGYKLQFIGQIVLEYTDGTSEIIASDDSFKTRTGGLLMSDPKAGDIYDARLEPEDWKTINYNDQTWKMVHYATDDHAQIDALIPSRSVPVKEMEKFIPKVLNNSDGEVILDYGQNIVGYVKMSLHNCNEGQMISLQHGEDLKDGKFNIGNLCMGLLGEDHFQQIDYIASGKSLETYCPLFSVFGFRYVKITGYDVEIKPEDFIAYAVYSACEETGDFKCSNELINQLVSNSRWSQKDNFLDVPTDCPTRERSPWSGDSHIYAKTASLFMNVYPFFEKWMYDLELEQMPSGKVANTFPATNTMHYDVEIERRKRFAAENEVDEHFSTTLGNMKTGNIIDGSAGWGDTATITPYTMYLCYGDEQILKNQYSSAKAWVEYMIENAKNPSSNPERLKSSYYQSDDSGMSDSQYVWDTCFHWGEWMEPDKPFDPSFLAEALTNPDPEVPTAFLAYSSCLVSKMAEILGNKSDAVKYSDISNTVKSVFQRHFVDNNGVIKEGRQAPNVRALEFGLVEGEQKKLVAKQLNEMVIGNDYHLNTGFLSTPFILKQLAENGYVDTAFRLLEQISSPGWLYPVTKGSTTILENWNAMDIHMFSYNHYSYGAVCDFLFSQIAGIKPDLNHPGYSHFFIEPIVGGSLNEAYAEYESIYGKIISSWKKNDTNIVYEFTIPANTTATVSINGCEKRTYGSGHYDITVEC